MADEKKQEPVTKQATKVQTVYGRMVHVVTGQVFDGVTEVPGMDPWVQAQVDAGKMNLVK